MVTGYHQLELCRSRFEHIEHGLVFEEVADFGDVAGVEEDVGLRERETVRVGWVGRGQGRGGVGVGDDEEAGMDGFGGHGWGFEGVSGRGDVKGRT